MIWITLSTHDLVGLSLEIRDPKMPNKFSRTWRGPCRVREVLSEITCIIDDVQDATKDRQLVHFERLKPARVRGDALLEHNDQSIAAEYVVPAEGGINTPLGQCSLKGGVM